MAANKSKAASGQSTSTGLVVLVRDAPARPGGPIRAEVPDGDTGPWLVKGWQQEPIQAGNKAADAAHRSAKGDSSATQTDLEDHGDGA
ncbi:hypothetical protein [Castellaniella sp.]|uniref:hypothetical protein n=1 Tax=Castellaniella sp. TaxID=1955812 RepID=UPI002AFFA831|nr:hypothetical protein [Castellaniella sp.]